MGWVPHLLHGLIEISNFRVVRQQSIYDNHATAPSQNTKKLPDGPGDIGEMVGSDTTREQCKGPSRKGKVLCVRFTKGDIFNPTFLANVLLGFFKHLHGEVGSYNAANLGGKVEGSVAPTAGDIEKNVVRCWL